MGKSTCPSYGTVIEARIPKSEINSKIQIPNLKQIQNEEIKKGGSKSALVF